eukprot:6202531-Pleurochrysis_carterae.AAC.2
MQITWPVSLTLKAVSAPTLTIPTNPSPPSRSGPVVPVCLSTAHSRDAWPLGLPAPGPPHETLRPSTSRKLARSVPSCGACECVRVRAPTRVRHVPIGMYVGLTLGNVSLS